MPSRRRFIHATLAMPFLVAARPTLAASPRVNADGGIAIRGADPVAYFAGAGPSSGSAEHAVSWNGATWYFGSAGNRERFEANPDAYAPRYGGYCAWAMSRGYLAPIDPAAWTIHGDRLYLNASLGIRRRWLRDIDENIALADANWPGILSQ